MKKHAFWALFLAMALLITGAVADVTYTFNPEKPYDGVLTGLYDNITLADVPGGEETASIYLAEGLQPWAPAVIVMTPDGTTAAEFAAGETGLAWRAVADAQKIGLAFLAPKDGAWNLTLDEAGRDDAAALSSLYMLMRSKSVKNPAPFSMDKTHVGVVGYGEGGAAALLCGAQTATEFSALCAVDAPALSADALAAAGEKLVLPFPADHTRGVEEMHVVAKTVETPVWFVNSAEANPDALAYFIAAADAKEAEANEYAETAYVGENPAVRIWVTDKAQEPAAIYEAFLAKTNRFMAMQDGGRVAFTTDFTQPEFTLSEELVNGELRRWVTYVPKSYDPAKETPLVLAIHGYTATAQSTVEESRWHDLAEENGFIVIYPQGLVREAPMMGNIPASCWVGGAFAGLFPEADPMVDVNFINYLLDDAEAKFNIDKTRIYATGHSNGSMMTWEMGVQATNRFAAIAPIGAMSMPSAFSSESLLPTWAFMGEYDGAGCVLAAESDNVNVLSAWNAHNGTDEAKAAPSEEYDGQWQTLTFQNEAGVPLVRFTGVMRTAHIYMPEESEAIWNDFFCKYSRGEDGTLYYEGEPVAAGEYVKADTWYGPAIEK